ncbi:MAG: tRNA preQ1(34) S-adenosylmethionine ribosyltransferase-isomerase QueA [Nitrospirae bacterium]|nr:MAG: tRNA preQ1(34) S-adenosylmethionine ribosyltransferase-isomerase QueA [Nitrospirota bacterium]
MKTSRFDFHLPKHLIALEPLKERDKAKMLVYDRSTGTTEHSFFFEITRYLKPEDLLILNNTKVIPARLPVRKPTGGKLELLITEKISPGRYEVMTTGSYTGPVLMPGNLTGKLINGKVLKVPMEDIMGYLWEHGRMPLPPYIKREPKEEDRQWYQTVYAKKEGSIAAPTAGLHFTEALLEKIKALGVSVEYLTLHVGVGTFLPIKSEEVEQHRMLPERFEVAESLIRKIEETKRNNGRVIAVGTTVTRAIEGFFSGRYQRLQHTNGTIHGQTDIFIYPGYKFQAVDCLVTNFHLPKATPLMLVSAFCGWNTLKKLYEEAIERGYRFFSYGDGMLIL